MMNCYQVFVLLILLASTNKSFARRGYGPGEQDWGYVDVREGAHMFYWLYQTTAELKNISQRPLVIWLGGPLSASTGVGNFQELGPLDINGENRESSWVKNFNVLFIDDPVGSGFSYVDDKKYLTTNNSQNALDLVKCMQVFFARHSDFQEVPLHIFAENYGGKMAPEFALELYYANQRGEINCSLVSIAMGNPFTSPIDSMKAWPSLLFYTGIVDQSGFSSIEASVQKTIEFVENIQWSEATRQWGITLTIIRNISNSVDFFNILKPVKIDRNNIVLQRSYNIEALETLMRGPVSEALGIPNYVKWGSQFPSLYRNLREDVMKPVVHFVRDILINTNLKVAIYSGQLDLSCPTAGTISWIDKLEWKCKSEYSKAPRQPINVNGYVEGYEKSGGNFNVFWVDRAGRFVPSENSAAMGHILKKLTNFG